MGNGCFIPKGIAANEYSYAREKAYRDLVESFEGVAERLEEGETLNATITRHSDDDGIWYQTWYTITVSDQRGSEWPTPTDNGVEG